MKGLVTILGLLVVLGVAVFLLRSEPAPSAEMTEAEIAQIRGGGEQEIEDIKMAGFNRAVWLGDARAVASFWTSDARTVGTGHQMAGSDFLLVFDERFFAFRKGNREGSACSRLLRPRGCSLFDYGNRSRRSR